MSGQNKRDLFAKINECIEKYTSCHKEKFPNAVIVTPEVYDLLRENNEQI